MANQDGFIGVFDSGVGGLTVLKACVELLPLYDFVYYADTAGAPYGNRPAHEIKTLTKNAVDRLIAAGAYVVVLACNTATSAAVKALREEGSLLIGAEPSVKPALNYLGEGQKALVLVTNATARQQKLKDLLAALGEDKFIIHAEPALAEMIEKNIFSLYKTYPYIRKILKPYADNPGIKAVVLGCTHYVLVKDYIATIMKGRHILDGNAGIAHELERFITARNIPPSPKGSISFITTGGEHDKDFVRIWREIVSLN